MEMLQHDITAKEFDTLKDGPSGQEKNQLLFCLTTVFLYDLEQIAKIS